MNERLTIAKATTNMVLDFEYGINTGNRFLDFVDHDEDPEDFIARRTQADAEAKKSTKDTKPVTSSASKKPTSKATGADSSTTAANTTSKTNKENLSGKSTGTDQRRQQPAVFGEKNNQQMRSEGGRGERTVLIFDPSSFHVRVNFRPWLSEKRRPGSTSVRGRKPWHWSTTHATLQ